MEPCAILVSMVIKRKKSVGFRWPACLVVILLCAFTSLIIAELLLAKTLYSYRDAQGTNVITDQYDRIPPEYRSAIVTVEQESDSSTQLSQGVSGFLKRADSGIGGAAIDVPGFSPYQSHLTTIAGSLALFCFALRYLSQSQVVRFLSLWGLVMLGLVAPLLIYFSQDSPLDVLRGEATNIQSKQQQHLKQAQ
jgi:hypothetical protein